MFPLTSGQAERLNLRRGQMRSQAVSGLEPSDLVIDPMVNILAVDVDDAMCLNRDLPVTGPLRCRDNRSTAAQTGFTANQ